MGDGRAMVVPGYGAVSETGDGGGGWIMWQGRDGVYAAVTTGVLGGKVAKGQMVGAYFADEGSDKA